MLPFDFSSVPYSWALCFNHDCPLKETCIRHFAGQHLPDDILLGNSVYPNTTKNGKCKFFIEKRIIRKAWGFDKLFLNVKYIDYTSLRDNMKYYLGGKTAYYRYKNGKLTLTPAQQEQILDLFREYGYTEELTFDHYIDQYDFDGL